jgi:hypothetical protein
MTITITLLEIVYYKLSPAIRLRLQAGNKRKMLMLFLLEVRHDIIFWHAQLKAPRKQELRGVIGMKCAGQNILNTIQAREVL